MDAGTKPSPFEPILPQEMAERAELIGAAKAAMPWLNLLALGVLGGAFIALGAAFFTTVTTETGLGYGPTRLLGGVAFSLGLVLVVIAGAELFTGDNLMVMAWAGGRISLAGLARAWSVVYVGNLLGALGTVALVYLSGQWHFAGDAVGANAMSIANNKVNLDLSEAFFLGVLCNGLVCLAVWLTYSARSLFDKAVAVVFPISAFVASGYEHSIANMYFIPLGLLLKDVNPPVSPGTDQAQLENLDILHFLLANLLPVTAGNLVGGGFLVGAVYWFIYRRTVSSEEPER
jgi:formate/nitrite transporter